MQTMVDGELKGRVVTLVTELIADADLQTEIEIFPRTRAFDLAKTRKNTLIFSMVRNPEREPYFHWIVVVNTGDLSFISLSSRDDTTLNTIEDAKSLGGRFEMALTTNTCLEGISD
jgi:polar amino acid transport system substrate-binding protein